MTDQVHNYIIDTLRTSIGSQLSTTGPVGNQRPSVVKYPTNAPQPDYPYAIVQYLDQSEVSSGNIQTIVNEDDNPVYTQIYEYLFQVRVYGDVSSAPSRILRDFKKYLNIDRVVGSVRKDTNGAFTKIYDLTPSYIQLSDRHIQTCSLNIIWTGEEVVVDLLSSTIDSIIINNQ